MLYGIFFWMIWMALFLMLMAGTFAGLSDTGALKMPYQGGFGFLFLAVSFSALVGLQKKASD